MGRASSHLVCQLQALWFLPGTARDHASHDEPREERHPRVDRREVLRPEAHGPAFGRISNSNGGSIEIINQPGARCNGLQSQATTPRKVPFPGIASRGITGPIVSSSRPSSP